MSFQNISLLTGNLQPKGHPFFVDSKTVEGAAALLGAGSLVSHLTHKGAEGDRIGKEIGFFKGIFQDGPNLRAKGIEFLESFKTNFKAAYENLAEMADKFPDKFGVSLHMKYRPVWVMPDGSEVPAKVVDGELAERAPKGAIRDVPSARVTAVKSGDFVTDPAANLTGLLSCLLAEIDSAPIGIMAKTDTFDQAAVDAKLAEQKTALTAELSTAHKTALDTVTAQLTAANAAKGTAEAALAARDSALTAVLAEAGIKVATLDSQTIKAALTSRIEGEAQTLLAARGIKPLPDKIVDAKLTTDPKTDAEIATAYLAMKHGTPESLAFVEKHRDALWRIQSGK